MLRAWRDAQPEVVSPILPTGLREKVVPAAGAFCGGILFEPFQRVDPRMVLHFHGGGFVVGSPHTHRIVAATICAELGLPVLSAAYRLAPEHCLPDQPADAAAAIEVAEAMFDGTVILAGDSAGALVALWGYHAAPASRRDRIAGALLFYGIFGTPPSPDEGDPALVAAGLDARSIGAAYRRVDPKCLIGTAKEFTPMSAGFRLPAKTVVIGAGADPLVADSHRFAACRPECCTLQLVADEPHGFLSSPQPSARARSAVRSAAASLML
ncbi:alpha/beta hydrolase fold domain-containing protein [Solirhodobacter olei]|uniref:alpha/beta hydrolase fold domain-containing protein n=1 Tax=Solirhodobacter olei TaxID=2493082 RepID=UPI0013E3C396|nr:alpha/beta hydrolase [Solirhodobacter olei]